MLQPNNFGAFHCIGSDCEDTCCDGWSVLVDKPTYEKYQACSDPELGPSLHSLVVINPATSSDEDCAKITLSGSRCPFLSEGLCSIQKRLGEDYLSNMCATYPRVMNMVDGTLQWSLDLSCPEAARVVLLNPNRVEFDEVAHVDGRFRHGKVSSLDATGLGKAADGYRLFREARRIIISVLQDRSRPVSERLLAIGGVCDKLSEGAGLDEIQRSVNDVVARIRRADPGNQLAVVVELILARISSDFTPLRFRECYREFMHGIRWTEESTMEEIASNYAEAYAQHYAPFMRGCEYMLEQYLVNYVFRTMFPFGTAESNQRLRNHRGILPITAQFLLLAVYYAIARMVLIGMAGLYGPSFSREHVVKLLQSCTKTFEHSEFYPGRAIEILAAKGMTSTAAAGALVLS